MFPASDQPQPTLLLPSVLLAGIVIACLAVPALAGASTVAGGTSTVAGASAGISANTASELKQETGYSASQLGSKPVCGTPQPGTMACMAQVLVLKATGKPVQAVNPPQGRPLRGTRAGPHAAASSLAPQTQGSSGTAAPQVGSPQYLQWGYDLGALSQNDGTGDTVAIVDAYGDSKAYNDLTHFRSEFDLPPCLLGSCLKVYNQTGIEVDSDGTPADAPAGDPTGGWEVEESLDMDAVSSLCPNCNIVLVEADSDSDSDLLAAVAEAHALGADQISLSFSEDESPGHDTANGRLNGTPNIWWFSGVPTLAAAGDNAYLGTSTVSYPAAHNEVTAVGGTSLSIPSSGGNARGFNETTWNDSSEDEGATESGCDVSQSLPSYQSAIASADGCNGRAYNDISADADPETGLYIYDSFGGSQGLDGSEYVGGTSLATPLSAAYEAITGVDSAHGLSGSEPDTNSGSDAGTLWPQWAYTYAAELNDISSGNDVDGSSGPSCQSGQQLICDSTAGWDGPTGNGSISGDIVTGNPQIGGTYASGETLSGGIYPNGTATSYTWEYATNTDYAATSSYTAAYTPPTGDTVSGQTLQSVSSTISALDPGVTYDYRLDITYTEGNSSYTIYGYNNSFVATSSSDGSGGGSSGSSGGGGSGGGSSGSSGAGGSGGGSSGSTGTTGSGSTMTTPSSGGGSTSGSSGTTANAEPAELASPRVASLAIVGGKISVTGGKFANAVSETVQLYRCAHSCVLLNTGGSESYKVHAADAGHYIKLKLTVTGQYGTTPLVATDWIGPIRAAGAGAASLSSATRAGSTLGIYGTSNLALASVQVTKHSGRNLVLAITKRGSARTQVWAYLVSGGSVISCTPAHVVGGKLKLDVAVPSGQSLKLVAVRG